jgi:ethanolamine kinase
MKILSEYKLGPRIYCKFENGICYEFLPGIIVDSNVLLNEEIFSKVAQLVAKMHSIKIDGEVGEDSSILFKKIHGLLNLVPSDYDNKLYGAKEDICRIPRKEVLKQELDFMEDYIKKLCIKNKSKLVFSHNDLLLANIIYNKKEDTISFIDYEYSGPNWNAYDIANHFNEYAGVDTVNYNLYPSKEYQMKWLNYYLKALLKNDKINEEIVENFYKEVNKFALVSHLFWGIWSIVQASYPNSVLNFADYSCIRLDEYFRHKQEYIDL